MVPIDGDRQQAPAGSAVPVEPLVEMRAPAGQPVVGATIECSITGGAGSVSLATATTDARGRASCGAWTLGAQGAQTLRVAARDSRYTTSSPVVFSATAVAAGGFAAGPPRSWAVSVAAGGGVADTVTGLRFVFPAGGQGTLEIARVQPMANEPATGLTRFTARFTGTQTIEVAVPLGGGDLAAYFLGEMSGVATSGPAGPRWWALPVERVRNDTAFVVLRSASTVPLRGLVSAAPRGLWSTAIATPPTVQVYATAPLPPTSPTATVRRNYRAAVEQLIDWWSTTLSSAPGARLTAAVTADPWNFSTGASGDAYYAKGWFTTYNLPWLYYNTNRDLVVSARHEGSHYVTHMLLGDPRYRELEAFVPGSGHDLGLVAHGFRNSLIEEYSHIANFLMSGALDNHDLRSLSPVNNFRHLMGRQPNKVDFPSLEGFGAGMLAALTRSGGDTLVYDFFAEGSRSRAPARGLTNRQILDVMATGPGTPMELRDALVPVAGGEATLAAVVEPLGWSYQGFGRIVNEMGVPIPEAVVASVVRAADGKSYRTVGSTPAGTTGRIWLPRLYPGTSTLRVYLPKSGGGIDSSDVTTVTVPWSTPTTDSVDLKDIVVPRLNAFTGIYIDLTGVTSPNAAGTDACRPNFSVSEMLVSNPVSGTISFPLTWNGLNFSTQGSTSFDIPPEYAGSRLRRYEQTMTANGTLTPGKADTLWATLTASSSQKESAYIVDVQTKLGRWVTAANTVTSMSLRSFPVTVRSSTPASLRGTLTGAAAATALGTDWSFSHYWIPPDLPTFHPQNCTGYELGSGLRIDVSFLQR